MIRLWTDGFYRLPVTNVLCTSPVGSTISLSCTLSTTSSEKCPARPDPPTPSVGIVAATIMKFEPEKNCWQRVARD